MLGKPKSSYAMLADVRDRLSLVVGLTIDLFEQRYIFFLELLEFVLEDFQRVNDFRF